MNQPLYILGLTGSIGMGKSTTADMFCQFDIPVWSADKAVHDIYRTDKATIQKITRAFPGSGGQDGINREKLRDILKTDPDLFEQLEAVVHPAVRKHRQVFLDICKTQGHRLVVLDIPLLYEVGADKDMDGVLVVTATPEEQRRRVLSRKHMTETDFQMILERQMPDAEKQRRADFVIETKSLDYVRQKIHTLIQDLTGGDRHA